MRFVVEMSGGPKLIRCGDKYKVEPSPNLRYEIGQLLGADAVAA